MVKGTHKQMVVLRTNGSKYYEQAYFVLREQTPKEATRDSMMAEANRILDESQLMPQPRKKRLSRRAVFVLGALTGGGATGLLVLIVLLL